MKLNKVFAMFMLVASLGMVACSEKNSPSGPGGGGQGDDPVVTIDTTKAISIADAINKADSGEEVVIKGYVTFAYDMENGKQDAWIASVAGTSVGEIEAFKCTVAEAVAKGDYVAVRGQVVIYTKKDGSTIYEIKDGIMQIIRKGTDTTPIIGSLEGDGTEAKPYTVADVLALQSTKEGPAYVKGIIVGQVNGTSMKEGLELAAPFTGNDSGEGTNIVIAAATGETNTAMMVPVQLPSGMREFSLPKDASMLGKEIIIYGKMQKYFGQAGVKEMSYAKIGEKTYGSKPVAITGNEKLNETLLTQSSFDKFTVVNVSGDLTWVFDAKYGAKMSGYDNEEKKTFANEDWFISPAFDATGGATLTFEHARGPKASMSVDTKNYTVWVSNDFDGDVATATWTQIAIPTHGTTPWGYVNSGNMVIPDANCAANCRIAWKYVCDDKESATWEIKNIIVK